MAAAALPAAAAVHRASVPSSALYTSLFKHDNLAFCRHVRATRADCGCGEKTGDTSLEWTWDQTRKTSSANVSPCGTQVEFHPVYSAGTALATGSSVLTPGYHHYWEVKLTRPVYGTDVMVGVTTKNINFSNSSNNFASLIGRDGESWGFSYQGYTQHAGRRQKYVCRSNPNGPRQESVWSMGSLVGIHLDTFRGTLEFYINRKPLGVAFHGLKDKLLYPVVSSTAAKSGLRLICAQSFPTSLQFDCIKLLSQKYCPDGSLLPLSLPPGLVRSIQNNYWFFFNCTQYLGDDVFMSEDSFDNSSVKSGSQCSEYSPIQPKRRLSIAGKRKIETDSESSDEEYFFGDINKLRTRKLELMEKNRSPAVAGGPRTRGRGSSASTTRRGADATGAEGAGEQEVCSGEQEGALDVSTPCCSQDLVYRSTPTPGVTSPPTHTRSRRAGRGNQASKEVSSSDDTSTRQTKAELTRGNPESGPSTRTRRYQGTLLEQNNGGVEGSGRRTAISTRLKKETGQHKPGSRGNYSCTDSSEGKDASHSEVSSRQKDNNHTTSSQGKEFAPCEGYQASTRKKFVLRCRKEK